MGEPQHSVGWTQSNLCGIFTNSSTIAGNLYKWVQHRCDPSGLQWNSPGEESPQGCSATSPERQMVSHKHTWAPSNAGGPAPPLRAGWRREPEQGTLTLSILSSQRAPEIPTFICYISIQHWIKNVVGRGWGLRSRDYDPGSSYCYWLSLKRSPHTGVEVDGTSCDLLT